MIKATRSLVFSCMASFSLYANQPVVVAHRGASGDAPENTLPAFRLAWEQGADAIEGDFHLSKDGVIVCFHDARTKKRADEDLVVSESTVEALKALDVGAQFDARFKGTAIPTIAEAFATVPAGKSIYVEIKCGPEILPVLLKEIRNSELSEEQIVVISFHEEVIRQVKEMAPQFKAFWLCSFKKSKLGRLRPSLETVLQTLTGIRADGLSSNTKIPDAFIPAIADAGYEWHVWTVNDVATAQRMKALGARSITTDFPARIGNALAESGR